MDYKRRIETFALLSDKISLLSEEQKLEYAYSACNENAWFTTENVLHAFDGISYMLQRDKLERWISTYELKEVIPRIVGIVMAGNIPMVGFHDLLAVLISGNYAALKTSTQDSFLIKLLIRWIVEIEPGFSKNISLRERLTDIDAVIATGSDNTSRYFEYYFRGIPNVIRKNRTSVAILTGDESDQDLTNLGKDIFWYFGLGCRNVSKVFIPSDYDPDQLFKALQVFEYLANNHKYNNNYDYYKSIFLVNGVKHLDTGFLLWHETTELVSPISVLYAERYSSKASLNKRIKLEEQKIQCIVGAENTPFGKAQTPDLWDYADNVDTLKFLNEIK